MNVEPLRQAINKILANPSCWNQTKWHCGTTHCVGGHIQIDAGRPAKDDAVISDVKDILQADAETVGWICDRRRTLSELHTFTKAVMAGEEYWDANGYDRDGYHRNGYNRNGYNRDGYDRDGYHRNGYHRNGYDRNGYNRDGYNRDGCHRNGYDRDGYNRDGYNRDGYDRNGQKLQPL